MSTREDVLLQNLKDVHVSLEQACKRAGRSPKEVTLLAVTKYAADEDVQILLKTGQITDVGESRLQQAQARWQQNPAFARWNKIRKHFIGHLQKNKAAKVAQFFDFVDSLDNLETAVLLAKHVPAGKTLRVLVQVKLTDKKTQSGLPLQEARRLVRQIKAQHFANLCLCGYMGIAPQGVTVQTLRTLFRSIKEAFEEDFPDKEERYLSLGMSEDFIVAVEEGSSLPRIGSKLFAKNLEEV